MKVMLVCSPGGHLTQLYRLRPWWSQHERSWVTFDSAQTDSLLRGEQVEFAYSPTTRNIPNAVRNWNLARRLLAREKPDLLVSNGAGVAFPFFVVARARGIKTVYIEVYDRVTSRTLTGRLCYPLAQLFLVQWPEQLKLYPRGELVGCLL